MAFPPPRDRGVELESHVWRELPADGIPCCTLPPRGLRHDPRCSFAGESRTGSLVTTPANLRASLGHSSCCSAPKIWWSEPSPVTVLVGTSPSVSAVWGRPAVAET